MTNSVASPLAGDGCLTAIRASPDDTLGFRRLKSALSFFVNDYGLKPVSMICLGCVINYGLEPVAWTVFALPLIIRATGFSQWLVMNLPERRNHSAKIQMRNCCELRIVRSKKKP